MIVYSKSRDEFLEIEPLSIVDRLRDYLKKEHDLRADFEHQINVGCGLWALKTQKCFARFAGTAAE